MTGPRFNRVSVQAPATVANVGPGFDCFGLALKHPCDQVTVALSQHRGVRIGSIQGDEGKLPRSVDRNTAGVVVRDFCRQFGIDQGLDLFLKKGLPLKSGLGSSAASSVAALLAVNHLFGDPLNQKDFLPFLLTAEKVACGAGHADNVAPCLMGGFVVILDPEESVILEIGLPSELYCVIFHPQVEVPTRRARSVLPTRIPADLMRTQGANMVGLVTAMIKSDYELIARCLRDAYAVPHRKTLIPGYDALHADAISQGALGLSISGSGPSVFALCRGYLVAERVHRSGMSLLNSLGIPADGFMSALDDTGARVVEEVPL